MPALAASRAPQWIKGGPSSTRTKAQDGAKHELGRFEGATVTTFDVRTWALHDAVFQLARELGLASFSRRVQRDQGALAQATREGHMGTISRIYAPEGCRTARPRSTVRIQPSSTSRYDRSKGASASAGT